jgi:two-component system cell cycle sensor histidine kinase/response regulator CckA
VTQPLHSPLGDERGRLLDDLARDLNAAGDFESIVRIGARCAVPRFADLVVLVLTRDHTEEWLQLAHSDPVAEVQIGHRLRRVLPDLRRVAANSLKQGKQFRWIPRIAGASTRFLWNEPAVRQLLEHLEVHSLMVVPLRSGGRILGAMAFSRVGEGEPFHAADLAMAQVIARRVAAAVDVTELQGRALDERSRRHRLEAALQKWIQVFEHAGWGAAIVDGLDSRIEAVNPAFARLHGYVGPDSLSGRLFSDVLAQDRAGEPESWASEGQELPHESVHQRADGSLFPVLTNVTPLTTTQGTTSYVVTVQDLTELKRAEERLRRAQRLEAVGRLAGGVAHEVNNMMTIVLGFSDLLARDGALPPDRVRDVEEIRKAAARAGKITQQLLAFSRQQILQPTDLQLNEVVGELEPMLRLLLPANIELDVSLAPLGATVHADRAQLDQVIINLAFNARDAMPGGGLLRLTTDARWLNEDDGRRLIGIPIPPGLYGLVSVVDTGHGMDPATTAQVFEPFFTTKPVGSGTGLGLATVYGIVKQSGGYVWIESAPGVGTSVTVCLPQVQQMAPVAPGYKPERLPVECRTGTVLVIEDEEGVRELAQRVLEQLGHHVLEAHDGNQALSLLEKFSTELDLILSDAVVPRIGTAELEDRVHELRPDLPVVFMSGYSRDEMVERGLINPYRPFLQKPFTTTDLAEVVCRVLERRTAARGGAVTT